MSAPTSGCDALLSLPAPSSRLVAPASPPACFRALFLFQAILYWSCNLQVAGRRRQHVGIAGLLGSPTGGLVAHQPALPKQQTECVQPIYGSMHSGLRDGRYYLRQ